MSVEKKDINIEEKRLEVEFRISPIDNLYPVTKPSFFWASFDNENKNKVIQISRLHTCRESLAVSARDCYNKNQLKDEQKSIQNLIEFSKIIMGVLLSTKNSKEKLILGHKVLNIVEDHYGWPLTKMYLLEKCKVRRQYPDYYDSAVFIGTSKWMRSTHMISLFALLIRLGICYSVGGCNTFEAIKNYVNRVSKKASYGDIAWARSAFEKMDALLGNYDYVFKGLTRRYLYGTSQYVNKSNQDNIYSPYRTGFDEGISLLTSGKSKDGKLSERLARMCDKLKM